MTNKLLGANGSVGFEQGNHLLFGHGTKLGFIPDESDYVLDGVGRRRVAGVVISAKLLDYIFNLIGGERLRQSRRRYKDA